MDLAMRIASALSAHEFETDLADLTVADAVHRVARRVVENAREVGLDAQLSDVTVRLSFHAGSAHWTATIRGLGAAGSGPCEALDRLAARVASRS